MPEIVYDMFGLVEHTGQSVQQGHYRAFVQEKNQWYACNDAWVTFASEEEVLNAQGYLLFYIRRGCCPQ